MDLPTILKGLQQLKDSAPILFASRYLTGVALAVLLYDHALTFGDEVKYMWDSRRSQESWTSRINYFITRYTTEAIMIFVAYVNSGVNEMDDGTCKRFVWLFVMVATVFLVSLQVTVVLRMYNLWDRRKAITLLLGVIFILISVGIILLAVFTAKVTADSMMYLSFLRSCTSNGQGDSVKLGYNLIRALIGTMTLFDLLILVLAFLNALEVPTQSNQDLAYLLQRDGTRIFFVLFLLRLTALITTLAGGVQVGYILLPFIWSLISVSNSRITLRVAETTYQRSQESLDDLTMDELPTIQHTPVRPVTPSRTASWGTSSLGHMGYATKESSYWQ